MNFIPDATRIAWRSHSMWGFYLIAAILIIPEVLWGLFEIETSPYWVWSAAFVALVYGAIGRLLDQGLASGRRSIGRVLVPLIRLLILCLVLMSLMGMSKSPTPGDVLSADRVESAAEPVEIQSAEAFDEAAFTLIAKWEGKRNKAYRDIVGVWTICYGSTRGVVAGMVKTDAQCKALLIAEIREYRDGLHRYFTDATKAKRLPPARDAAYTSLAYNVGWAGAGRSTAVKRLNAGDVAGGCKALTWWNKAGGRVVIGLVNRRKDEYRYCMRGAT